jgi:hypothetical protein
MRRQLKKNILFDSTGEVFMQLTKKASFPVDSPEVLHKYYCDKLTHLQKVLNNLTILEHACEIEFICRDIILTKKKLQALNSKHKMYRIS